MLIILSNVSLVVDISNRFLNYRSFWIVLLFLSIIEFINYMEVDISFSTSNFFYVILKV